MVDTIDTKNAPVFDHIIQSLETKNGDIMKNNKWSKEIREGKLEDFGAPVITITKDKYILQVDERLARMLGWKDVLRGDDDNLYEVLGVVEKGKNKAVVLEFSRLPGLQGHYSAAISCKMNRLQAVQIKRWIIEKLWIFSGLNENNITSEHLKVALSVGIGASKKT